MQNDNIINLNDDFISEAVKEAESDNKISSKEDASYLIDDNFNVIVKDQKFVPIELDSHSAASFLGLNLGLAAKNDKIRLNYTHLRAIDKKFFELRNYHPSDVDLEDSTYDYFTDVLLKNIKIKMYQKRLLPTNGVPKKINTLKFEKYNDGSTLFKPEPMDYVGENINGEQWVNRCMTNDPKHRQGQYIFFLTGFTVSILAQQVLPELNITYPKLEV